MLFTSLEFFVFLPLVLLLFSAIPVTQRWAVLLLASYLFYGIWQPFNLVYLGGVTIALYGCGWTLEQEKRLIRAANRRPRSSLQQHHFQPHHLQPRRMRIMVDRSGRKSRASFVTFNAYADYGM